MPHSQHDLLMGPTGLRDYLSEALPDSQLMEVSADADYQPILLLATPQVTAWVRMPRTATWARVMRSCTVASRVST